MASRKTDPRKAQVKKLQNFIRGSASPLGAVSAVRGRVPKSDLEMFVSWLPTVSRGARGILSGLFPTSLSDLCHSGAFEAVNVEREIAWAAAVIRQNATRISSFVEISELYEKALLTGETEECSKILSKIDLNFGFSLWSIETRFALLQVAEGLEAQKEFLATIRSSRTRQDIVAFLAHFISRRNEPATTPIRFISQLKEQVESWNGKPDLTAYILFKLTNQFVIEEHEFAGILRHETSSSLIDQYDTFVRLGGHAAVFGDENIRRNFTTELARIAELIDDERIRRTLFILTEQSSWLERCSQGNLEAYDAALDGDYENALTHISKAVSADPLDIDAWIKCAEIAYATDRLPSDDGTLRGTAISNLTLLVGKKEGQREAVTALLKDGLNHRLQRFAAGIEDMVWRELSTDPRRLPSSAFSFLNSRYLRPGNLSCLV